ncbi:MAG: sulfate/thiosulfate transport system permease protein, partial [Actinomycetota bacterium]|nr:sulfate/thiosulfate transport system permease protein [Actinomycetota bacterium]
MTRWSLRLVALAYLTFLLVLPVAIVVWRTFDHGLPAVFHALSTAAAVHAIWLTVVIAFYAVVLNTVFGVIA